MSSHATGIPGGFSPDGNRKYLLDPITAYERNINHVPVDRLLDFNRADKALYGFRTAFMTLPATIVKGLRGDEDITTADYGLMTKVPYYLTGLVLMSSFLAAGRKKISATRMGAGILLYYVGVGLANAMVNGFYKLRYGIDLTQKYQRADGRIENVYNSVDAPRFDLLSPEQYRQIQRKMGIPPNLADREQACREQILRAVSCAEALKIVLGVLFAGVGAGHLARSDSWAVLLNGTGAMEKIWKDAKIPGVLQRIRHSFNHIGSLGSQILRERLVLGKEAHWFQKFALWLTVGMVGYGLYQSLRVVKPKQYQSSPILPNRWGNNSAGNTTLETGSAFQQFVRHRNLEGGTF